MKKSEAINLLNSEGWTKADAQRALEQVNFKNNPDELTIRQVASSFAGKELLNRQYLQRAQKTLVTKERNKLQRYEDEIRKLKAEIRKLVTNDKGVSQAEIQKLLEDNKKLKEINQELKQDNKRLKNIVDLIKLKLAQSTNNILRYEDSEIRQAVVKLLHSTLG